MFAVYTAIMTTSSTDVIRSIESQNNNRTLVIDNRIFVMEKERRANPWRRLNLKNRL